MPPSVTVEMAKGFTLYMVKALISGRADEVIDLARTNLWRQWTIPIGLSAIIRVVEGPTNPIRDSNHSAWDQLANSNLQSKTHHMTYRNGKFARTLVERNREA
jgi:hypothetical protein